MSVYYDPYDAEINVDPYSVYRQLREEAPVYYNEKRKAKLAFTSTVRGWETLPVHV